MAWFEEYFARYRDYPLEVVIETTGKCNARCVFCPHKTLERKNADMPEKLFHEIIRQLEEIPKSHIFYISPFKVNELFMDSQIFERIGCINHRLPNARIRIFSNFNLAEKSDYEKLCTIRNLSDIDISINSLDAGEYHALMGLDYDRTIENVLGFLEYVQSHGLRMQSNSIVLSRVSQSSESDNKFLKDFSIVFREYLPLVTPKVIPRGEWIDYLRNDRPLRQNQPCARWANIEICCTGEVAYCCMDGRCACSLGNVRENTLLEIYNQPAYRLLRTKIPNKADRIPCTWCSQ